MHLLLMPAPLTLSADALTTWFPVFVFALIALLPRLLAWALRAPRD